MSDDRRGARVGPVTAADFAAGRWRARWVWHRRTPLGLLANGEPVLDAAEARGWVLLRRTFDLDAVPDRVPARATADARYELWVNGREVGRGPVRSHPQLLHYDLYDLAPLLRTGANTIAVLARHYGDPTPWWMPSTPTYGLGGGAFTFEADLGPTAGAGGSRPADHDRWLGTDASWRALDPGAWTPLPGQGIGAMAPEVCDGRLLPAGWHEPDFDDAAWPAATELSTQHTGWTGDHRPPSHPYGPLLPRPIPQLSGEIRRGLIVVCGHAPDGDRPRHDDPVHQVGDDERAVVRRDRLPQPEPSIEIGWSAATPAGAWVVTVDLGEQVSGLVAVELDAPAGTVVDVKAAEQVDGNGRLEALQQHSGFRYVCRGSHDRYRTFDPIGGRFLALAIRSTGPVHVRSVEVHERLFPRITATAGHHPGRATPPEAPTFRCSDPLLDDIWRVGRRTVDLCSHDAYLDCPSREQRAWVGDSVVHQLVDLTTNPDWSLAGWNVELAGTPRPDGMLPMAVAGDFAWLDRTVIPDWALHWIHALWNLHRYTTDDARIDALLPVAEGILRWFDRYRGPDGLLHDVGSWVLIDWSAVSTAGTSGALNALWARALREFARMCADRGRHGPARWAHERVAEVWQAFEVFWDPGRAVYVDHLVEGVPRRPVSQHTNAAAIVAGLVPDGRRAALADTIVDRERLVHAAWLAPGREATLEGAGDMYAGFLYLVNGPDEPWWDVEAGIVAAQPFFRYVVHDAVVEAGRADRIPSLCRDWAVLLDRSATTWSEVWYGGSHCHGWCATPTRDLVQHVLGVQPAAPGFGRVAVAPALGDLDWAEGSAPTPAGLVHVRVEADRVEIDTPLPAEVRLPGSVDVHAVGIGHHVIDR